MDVLSPEARSKVMAKVRSTRNRSTEWRLRACLVRAGIRGWTLNPGQLIGKPDFVFPARNLAVFVDGCFWHRCPKCYRRPSSRTAYWDAKITANVARDRKVNSALKLQGWRVLRIREHELADMHSVMKRIRTSME